MQAFNILFVLALAYNVNAYNYHYTHWAKPLQFVAPPVVTKELTTEENPCTAAVLRSPEVQAFADPLDVKSYIICTDIDVFERMPCAPGTFFDTTIRHCVPEGWTPPVCPIGLCKNQADCIIDEIKNEYKCLCRTGYTGLFCEINIDECALEGNQACAGGTCVDQLNGFYCVFGNEIGVSKFETIPLPCTLLDLSLEKQFFEIPSNTGNVYLQCTGESKFIVSRCAEMLFWNQELKTCTIDRPIVKTGICLTYPCHHDGECHDLGNNQFQCLCKPGFTGQLCEEVIDYCLSRPCQNGGRCVSHTAGYNCVCPNKVVDESCTSGVINPCKTVSEYLPYPSSSTKYFVCGLEGFAFSKTCPLGLFWDDLKKTCVDPTAAAPLPKAKAPKKSIFDLPAKAPQAMLPPMPVETKMEAYGSVKPTELPKLAPMPITQAPVEIKKDSYASVKPTELPKLALAPAPLPAPVEMKKEAYGSAKQVTAPKTAVPFKPTFTREMLRPQLPKKY
jgi:hypothetical protein